MSQLSFFDVDLSQSVKKTSPVTVDLPSQAQNIAEKTVEKMSLVTAKPTSNRDFHKELIQTFNQTARYHSRVEMFRDFIYIAAISLENR